MKRYRYSYQTVESYDNMVSNYHFLLRCMPCDTSFQRVESQQLHLLSGAKYSEGEDTFGNIIHYGMMNDRHDIFVVASSGVVVCGEYKIEDNAPSAIYKSHSHLSQCDVNIFRFNKQIEASGSELEIASTLATKIYEYMSYSPGETSVTTTSAESFAMGKGVCQDYSHLLLALCRERGIYARYVVGFVMGTGETHSWVEVYSKGAWYGVDPTHNRVVGRGYIKVSHGRDASDCSVVRGLRRGVTGHTTQIRVIVEEI